MEKRTDSRSDIQLYLEQKILRRVREELNDSSLESLEEDLPLNDEGVSIHPDFYSETTRTIGEIHTHLGRLKGSQPDKIASDVLKLLLFDKVRKVKFKKYIVVCNDEEYKQLTGKSSLALAIRKFRVRVMKVTLDDEDYEVLRLCMKRQNLVR